MSSKQEALEFCAKIKAEGVERADVMEFISESGNPDWQKAEMLNYMLSEMVIQYPAEMEPVLKPHLDSPVFSMQKTRKNLPPPTLAVAILQGRSHEGYCKLALDEAKESLTDSGFSILSSRAKRLDLMSVVQILCRQIISKPDQIEKAFREFVAAACQKGPTDKEEFYPDVIKCFAGCGVNLAEQEIDGQKIFDLFNQSGLNRVSSFLLAEALEQLSPPEHSNETNVELENTFEVQNSL